MSSDSSDIWPTLAACFQEARHELFDAYGIVVERISHRRCESSACEGLASVIGYTAPGICGSVALQVPRAALRESYPGGTPTPAQLEDWIGELANQLLGRFKNKLLPYGVSLGMSTPSTVSGTFRIVEHARSVAAWTVLGTSHGEVATMLAAEIGPAFELHREPVCEQAAPEGDLIFF